MKKQLLLAGMFASVLACAAVVVAQEATITPPESIVADGVPQIPASLAETAGRYGAYRSASLADWNPVKREMLIATRFGDTPQLHLVSAPGGERHQLTFYPDAVTNGRFHPNGGDYIVFSKDIGGGEWYQLYRYDLKTGDVTLLTDGKARNLMGPWSSKGDALAYMSTRTNGKRYGFVGDESGGSEDGSFADEAGGRRVGAAGLVAGRQADSAEGRSCRINESYLWLVDTTTGEKTALTPRDAKEKISYGDGRIQQRRERHLRHDRQRFRISPAGVFGFCVEATEVSDDTNSVGC